ncbi:AMP-binding protein [Streptomyces johnsoniae]|uniref:AMP-binding protein n=1 Tax=Streptomyces johnsoniae TaxID=3075532 RepID=A0ABU2S6B8_9ACTN|nr:AMP-binding protein [Streptomyces sp. DSM 41886]MDT0444522.1 AMP-binding protein [Streptomyces sp. DSM 41886]
MPLITRLLASARRNAGAPAVVEDDRTHTYGDLDRYSAELAGALAGLGTKTGDVVAIHAPRGWPRCAAVMAAWRLGAGVVSIAVDLPERRARKVAASAGARLVIRSEEAPPTGFPVPTHPIGSLRGGPVEEAVDGPIGYVIPTSGSTGEPKAVAVPPVVLENLGIWHVEHWSHDVAPHTLHAASIGFDPVYEEMVATWLSGAALVVVDDETRRDYPLLMGTIREHGVSRCFLPLASLHGLAVAAAVEETGLPGLRELAVAGERLVINDEVREFCAADDIAVVNQYGPSETHVVTQYRLGKRPAEWPGHPPIGTAVVGAELLRCADGVLQPFAGGEEDELVIAGDCVGLGYLGDEDLTAQKFRTLPHVDGTARRCYFSGDLVRFDGTHFHFLARVDDQMKIRGYRVEPGEVEAVLAEVPGVRRAVAFGLERRGTLQLVACYARGRGPAVPVEDLRAACHEVLPDYMVPVQYWEVEDFPVTPNGKVDRATLRDMFGG